MGMNEIHQDLTWYQSLPKTRLVTEAEHGNKASEFNLHVRAKNFRNGGSCLSLEERGVKLGIGRLRLASMGKLGGRERARETNGSVTWRSKMWLLYLVLNLNSKEWLRQYVNYYGSVS